MVHTLICVEIFRIFDCDSYEFGTAAEEPDYIAGKSVSLADYSIKCNMTSIVHTKHLHICDCRVRRNVLIVLMKLKEKKQGIFEDRAHTRATGKSL